MINAISLEAVHTHTHTGNFIKINEGKKAFAFDSKKTDLCYVENT